VSLFKGPDGIYHADVRVVDVGRWHGSMRTRKKAEAQPRYDAVRRLFREAKGPNGAERRALIEQLRSGELAIERLESMVASGEALAPMELVTDTTAPWPTVDEARARYLDWIKVNPTRRKATHDAAAAQLKRFSNFMVTVDARPVRIGTLPLDRVTSAHVEAYQRSLIDAKAAANTITGYMARIGTLWTWIQQREHRSAIEAKRIAAVIHSPLDPETTSRETSRRDRWLTREEAAQLLEATPARFKFAVAAGLLGGFRIGEILHLRTHVDIDLELGTITVAAKQIGVDAAGVPLYWKPKTKRAARVVPIADDLRPFLEEQLKTFASDHWVMPAIEDPSRPFAYDTFGHNFTTIVENAELVVGRADPRGVVFHTLRHTFASWLVMAGIDLYPVAQLLGDTLAMVERTYAHLAPDFKRRAIEALKGAIAIPITAQGTATETATTEGR
jgi:integrase